MFITGDLQSSRSMGIRVSRQKKLFSGASQLHCEQACLSLNKKLGTQTPIYARTINKKTKTKTKTKTKNPPMKIVIFLVDRLRLVELVIRFYKN
jgi:hypothetical protein